MKKLRLLILYFLFAHIFFTNLIAQRLFPRPQDKGLANKRSAFAAVTNGIDNTIAIFSGSRYAFINECKSLQQNRTITTVTRNGETIVKSK